MALRKEFLDPQPELSTLYYTGVLKDENGDPLPAASVTTLRLWLYALDGARTIINSVSNLNILNMGRGTLDSSGNLAIELLPADMAIVDSSKTTEVHVMLIRFTYAGGVKAGAHEVEFPVKNLVKLP